MPSSSIKVLGLQQFARQQREFYVNMISDHLRTSHLHINKPHKHDFFATFLFTHGTGIHEIDFNTYEVKPGSIFLLSPGQTHNWTLSEDCEGIIFFHSQDFYETHYIFEKLHDFPFFTSVNNQAAIYLDADASADLTPLFGKILAEKQFDRLKTHQLVLSLITQVYINLERIINNGNTSHVNRHHGYYLKFLEFRQLVEANYRKMKSAQEYADKLNMTAKHLNRINRQIVNKTTGEIISDRIVLEAKRLLIYARNNFNEVAYDLGFDDYAHFSKLFKNKTGTTPSEFSKKYLTGQHP